MILKVCTLSMLLLFSLKAFSAGVSNNFISQVKRSNYTDYILTSSIIHFTEVLNPNDISSPFLQRTPISPKLKQALREIYSTKLGHQIFMQLVIQRKKLTFIEVTKNTDPDMVVAFRVDFDNLGKNSIHYTQDLNKWKITSTNDKDEIPGEEISSGTLGSFIMHELGHTEVGLATIGEYENTEDPAYDRSKDEFRAINKFENEYRKAFNLPQRKSYFKENDAFESSY